VVKVTFDHPLLVPILEQTYGCIVYQEQVMKIVQSLAGYTLGQADMVRRMMGKKQVEAMEKEEKVFINGKPETTDAHGKVNRAIDGCLKRGVPEDVAKRIWAQMKDFAKYAFNKSHAAAYSLVTYQTAYLKCYYEAEFLTSVLNNRITNIGEITNYTTYAKSEGIEVLPPDINESVTLFSVKDGKIRYGLAAIKNVGLNVIDEIVAERNKNGKFENFVSFIERMSYAALNKKQLENLIYAGAFDCLGQTRSQLIAVYEKILDRSARDRKTRLTGQLSFFDTEISGAVVEDYDYPDIKEYDLSTKLKKEKEVSGVYLTGHPLDEYASHLRKFAVNTSMLIKSDEEGEESGGAISEGEAIELGGMLIEAGKRVSRKGNEFGLGKLEDLYGTVDVMLVGYKYTRLKHMFTPESMVTIKGTVKYGAESATVMVDAIEPWNKEAAKVKEKKICFYLSFGGSDPSVLDRLQDILKAYPGEDKTFLKNLDDNKLYPLGIGVSISSPMLMELYGLIGEGNIKIAE